MSTINRRKKMEQDQIISSLFKKIKKSNNEKINMQLTIDKLTAEVNALKKEKEEQKDDWKVEIEKSEK